ncbi:MAG: tricarboxylate transporter [Proteobacteria bacterium]|nr:tricarboxylate transporter [Pseudomonadota bacterium]MDA1325046.1 tricarboxylate transporter [Pseudomonadota bacterium]
MTKRPLITIAIGGLAAAAMMVASLPAAAQDVDFSGKRVEWIIPYGTGGGSNRWARFYVPWLQKALPGNPVVAVKNMPGASSTKGTNYFARRGTTDGLSILGTSGSTQFPFLLGDRRVKYDYADWEVILATPVGGVVYVNKSLGVNSTADMKKLQKYKLKFGSQGPTSLDLVPLLAFEILGLNVKPVFGMKGRGPARLSFERGEVRIDYQTTPAFLKRVMPLVKKGVAIPLMTWGTLDANAKVVRDPTFPDLPHVGEVYQSMHGKAPRGPAWTAWKAFMAAGFPAQKMIVIKKGTPAPIVAAWRAAAAKAITLPGFEEAKNKSLGNYEQAVGAQAETLKKVATAVPPKAKQWVLDWLKTRYNKVP